MLLAYTPVNWSMPIELCSQVWEEPVIIKSLYLKVYLKLSAVFWTLIFFSFQLNYPDVFTDELTPSATLAWRSRLLTGGCTTLTILRESKAQCTSQGSWWYKSLICALMWLFALYSSSAGKQDRSSLPTLHNTSVTLCNSCTASNRGAAGFHWLTLEVDAHMPVGNENWFLQIHCTRWFKYFSWIWWRWKGKWESGSAIEKDLHWRDRNSIP